MNAEVINKIIKSKAEVIIFDIDGTLKDLCKEHSLALKLTLAQYCGSSARKNIILRLNVVAMAMVKIGLIPTNQTSQNILLWVFALLAGKRPKKFTEEYFKNYANQICLFDGVHQFLDELGSNTTIYFATINKQNYNLEECGIPSERITYTDGIFKVTTYKKLLKKHGIDKSRVLIVGDNLFDDKLSAKLLGVKCLLVNNYNSKFKDAICNLLNDR